ncbi:MAG: MoaD/ThiS family protein [Thermoleophilia bacterium]|nr:MoaD/ThiS family protein [Thermoleophilia bacterium]
MRTQRAASGGSITVKVHTILHLVAVVGGRDVEVELPRGSTLGGLFTVLARRAGTPGGDSLFRPGTSTPLANVRVMINGRQAEFLDGPDTVLQDQDEVLLLPAAAGG